MRAVDLIRRKRDSGELAPAEIQQFISAYTKGDVPDYQMSAWLMAVVVRGMSRAENDKPSSSRNSRSVAYSANIKTQKQQDHQAQKSPYFLNTSSSISKRENVLES